MRIIRDNGRRDCPMDMEISTLKKDIFIRVNLLGDRRSARMLLLFTLMGAYMMGKYQTQL
jgi:hypothetical protein